MEIARRRIGFVIAALSLAAVLGWGCNLTDAGPVYTDGPDAGLDAGPLDDASGDPTETGADDASADPSDAAADDTGAEDIDAGEDATVPDDAGGDPDTGEPDPCDDNETLCDEECVDTDTDPDHCGDCFNDCADGASCSEGECVSGCSSDDDCAGEAKCHVDAQSCVEPCCDFVREDVFANVPYSHDRFDIDLGPDGEPYIVFANNDDDTIYLAEKPSGTWLQDVVGDYSGSSVNIRLVVDDQSTPHVVTRRFNSWRYFRRDDNDWIEEDVWTEELSNGYTELEVDADGTAHILGVDGHEVHYARFSPGGTWTRETFEVDEDKYLIWLGMGLKADDQPVATLTDYDSDAEVWTIDYAERTGTGWEVEPAVGDTHQVHDADVGPDDEVVIAHFLSEIPHDGIELTYRDGGGWSTEFVNSNGNGTNPYLAIDDRGDPHVSFVGGEDDRFSGYTRFDGAGWETHEVPFDLVENAFWQRIAVDDDYRPHIAVYDSARDAIAYVTVQP